MTDVTLVVGFDVHKKTISVALVDAAALDRVFDLESFLRYVDAIFDRTLDALEVERV